MKIKMIAALAISTAAALPLAAIANACGGGGEIPENHDFGTPSGNIACSIYSDRPRTCRHYDCRVFAAAGVEPHQPSIAPRVREWQFATAARGSAAAVAMESAAMILIFMFSPSLWLTGPWRARPPQSGVNVLADSWGGYRRPAGRARVGGP